MKKILASVLMLCVTIEACVQYTEISLNDSTRVVGCVRETSKGEKVNEFLGIPYAEAPVGPLRFKAPVAKVMSGSPMNATNELPSCLQLLKSSQFNEFDNLWIPKKGEMSEDCLYLNIWVPAKVKSNSTLPVIIWIHGGGFFPGLLRL